MQEQIKPTIHSTRAVTCSCFRGTDLRYVSNRTHLCPISPATKHSAKVLLATHWAGQSPRWVLRRQTEAYIWINLKTHLPVPKKHPTNYYLRWTTTRVFHLLPTRTMWTTITSSCLHKTLILSNNRRRTCLSSHSANRTSKINDPTSNSSRRNSNS